MKSAQSTHREGYPFPGKYTVQFKYFKFNPKLRTTKRQTDQPLVIVNPEKKECALSIAPSDCEQPVRYSEQDNIQNKHETCPKRTCPTCGKAVKDLKSHTLIHTDSKNFPCSFCGKEFTYKSDRTLHENIHKGLKPYKCTQCSSSFAHRKSLLTHKVTHSKSRNYKCVICGKTYGHLIILKKHLAAHNNDRRFKCSVCDKAFLTKQVLQNHMLVHSNDRPHGCHICPKRFRRIDNLRTHLKIHNQETTEVVSHPNRDAADDDTVFVDIDQTDSQPGGALTLEPYFSRSEIEVPEEFGSMNQQSYTEESYEDQLDRLVGGESYSLSWENDGYQF
ncbi:zinc finger protein 43-like [Wyeomyia smithii]|uniref:zinc finger protein 43-like n=1 Tax=Wyeomyia smithii TaxID=174621 RepID=UPI0024680144|nr:zinc finger protein 43-like [Wyeomyia smithii]